MLSKDQRQKRIQDIIMRESVSTQADLVGLLRAEGIQVTQATVSRDINELRLVRLPIGKGRHRYALAQYGAHVLLIDADMRKGKLHRQFGVKMRKDGLSDILVGSLDWRKALHHSHDLDLISTGTLPPNPSKLLLGERFTTFIEEVTAAYDFVIVDAPPILAVTDAAIIGIVDSVDLRP